MLTSAPSRTRRPGRMLARLVAAVAVAALVVVTGVSTSSAVAPPAQPRGGAPLRAAKPPVVTYGIGPATGGKPDRRAGLNFDISPGGIASDTVAVVNDSAARLTLNLYAADGVQSPTGQIEYAPRATPGTGPRTWIRLHTPGDAPTVTVAARSTTIVPVTVAVPSDATPGDHVAGIVVSLTAKAVTTNGKQLDFDQGVGLSTTFHVSGELAPALRVEHLTAAYDGTPNPVGSGTATVRFTVHNVGNVTLGAGQRVDVSGLLGADGPAHPLTAVPALLPGSSIAETVRIPDVLPAVHLTAHVRLDPHPVVGEAVDGIGPVSAESGLWAVPWALLVLVAVVALVAAGLVLWRRAHPVRHSKHSSQRGNPRRGGLAAGEA